MNQDDNENGDDSADGNEDEEESGGGDDGKVNEIVSKFLNRGKGWQQRLNTSTRTLPSYPKRVTRSASAKVTKAKPTVAKTGETQDNPAIERILRLVKKGNVRSLRNEASLKKMDQNISDIMDAIDDIRVAITRKLLLIL